MTTVDGTYLHDNTPAEHWEQLGGENEFAIVRDGKVTDFMMWWMN